jgi:hypothetical protein
MLGSVLRTWWKICLTRDKLVSLQFRIYFWILTEGLPKRVPSVFRRLELAWLGDLGMFKDLELRYGERVSIPRCEEVGLDWAPFMSGAIHKLVMPRLISGSRLGRTGPVGLQYCLYVGFPCRESVYCIFAP